MSRMDKAMVGLTPQLEILKKTAKACIVLFPLLGVTWLFGVLTMSQVGVAAQYIFTIMNSIQGFLIFLFNCVRNSEIRSKVKSKFHFFHRPRTPSTIMPSPNPITLRQSDNVTMTAFNKRSAELPEGEQVLNNKGQDAKEKQLCVKKNNKESKSAKKTQRKGNLEKPQKNLEKRQNSKKV
ncbi:corticotropin-releasing factor receptor 2 [Exaiptasia diaphana]|uniref:G-protein coupled receptors family 2 profile 2 domain-containing protein n=1 Tax=Exaiptasia diaphana TaxID=2652724 RepID=A0A913Y9M3_EXADI|nr:corticotropin-releasing factor receptor 2 [Exaiptasia diaphana]